MDERPTRASVSAALGRAIDAFMGHDYDDDELHALAELASTLETAGARGQALSDDHRRERFIGQMVDVVDGAAVDEPTGFVPFLESPYTGTENPLAPSARVVRAGDTVIATVHLGLALEGAPGRAHGGAVSAIFDDVMGAVQRITGRTAYTRSLTVHYVAPFPADRDVVVTASEVECNDRTYTIEADATFDGRVVARCTAIFTRIDADRFGAGSAK